MSTNKEETLRQFCDVTGADEGRSKFFLESSNWQLDVALSSFYEHGGNADEAPANPAVAASSLPTLSDSDMESPPASPVQPQKKKEKKPKPSSKFATLDSLQQESSSDEEEEKTYCSWLKKQFNTIMKPYLCESTCPHKVSVSCDATPSKETGPEATSQRTCNKCQHLSEQPGYSGYFQEMERLETEVERLLNENNELRKEIAKLRENDEVANMKKIVNEIANSTKTNIGNVFGRSTKIESDLPGFANLDTVIVNLAKSVNDAMTKTVNDIKTKNKNDAKTQAETDAKAQAENDANTKNEVASTTKRDNIATLPKSENDASEEGQAFYAGGSERSGQQILGPGKGRKDIVTEVFKSVRERGAVVFEDEPSSTSRGRGAFAGVGYRLGQTADDHEPISAGNQPQQQQQTDQPRSVRLRLYREGFTVDSGPLRSYTDPEHADFLNCIRRGEIPPELSGSGGEVRVSLEDRRHEECPRHVSKQQPFSGKGHLLGSPTPPTVGATAPVAGDVADRAANQRAAQDAVKLNTAQPTTTIQFRLADGSRLTGRFNHTHTVGDLVQYVSRAEPAYQLQSFVLLTTFPSTELSNLDETLAQAKILNTTLLQRLK